MTRKTFNDIFKEEEAKTEVDVEVQSTPVGIVSREESESEVLSTRSRKMQQSRHSKGGDLASAERQMESFVQSLANNAKLISIPLLDPNLHAYWGSTADDMQNHLNEMLRKGCSYVTIDDIAPEFHHYAAKTSRGTDEIRCNEMVLLKMPYQMWAMLMTELHHKKPARLQDALGRDTSRNKQFTPLTMGGINSRNALDGLAGRDDIAFMPDGLNSGALKPIKKPRPEQWSSIIGEPTIAENGGFADVLNSDEY